MSSYYPLHRKVNRQDSYPITHKYHQELLNKLEPEMYISTPKNNTFKISGNYLDDKKHCGIKSSDYGKVSGCSMEQNEIFNNPSPDTIQKITDNSFSSQVFLEPYTRAPAEDIAMLPGFNYRNYQEVSYINYNQIDAKNDLDDKDLYKKYCSNRYKKFFENENKF